MIRTSTELLVPLSFGADHRRCCVRRFRARTGPPAAPAAGTHCRSSAAAAAAGAQPAPPPPPALPDVAFGPTTPSDAPKKLPKVTIKTPIAEQVIAADKAKDFEVKIGVKDWETAARLARTCTSSSTTSPTSRCCDPKVPVKLSELAAEDEAIAEGEHLLVAFPSRTNHESVKGQGAIAVGPLLGRQKGQVGVEAQGADAHVQPPQGHVQRRRRPTTCSSTGTSSTPSWAKASTASRPTLSGPGIDRRSHAEDHRVEAVRAR